MNRREAGNPHPPWESGDKYRAKQLLRVEEFFHFRLHRGIHFD